MPWRGLLAEAPMCAAFSVREPRVSTAPPAGGLGIAREGDARERALTVPYAVWLHLAVLRIPSLKACSREQLRGVSNHESSPVPGAGSKGRSGPWLTIR
jgi:hypothetical protein